MNTSQLWEPIVVRPETINGKEVNIVELAEIDFEQIATGTLARYDVFQVGLAAVTAFEKTFAAYEGELKRYGISDRIEGADFERNGGEQVLFYLKRLFESKFFRENYKGLVPDVVTQGEKLYDNFHHSDIKPETQSVIRALASLCHYYRYCVYKSLPSRINYLWNALEYLSQASSKKAVLVAFQGALNQKGDAQ